MSEITVGVTGSGSLIGQAIIKSLRDLRSRYELKIVGFDYFKGTVGSYWVDDHALWPDCLLPQVSDEEWIDEVIDSIQRKGVDVLLIGLDFELSRFAFFQNRVESETGCRVVVSPQQVIHVAQDKYRTYQFLQTQGLPCPRTYLPEELPADFDSFPCVVKPRVGWRSRDVHVVEHSQQLFKVLQEVRDPVVQQYIGTVDSEYTCGVIHFQDEYLQMIALRRELRDGNTFVARYSNQTPQDLYVYLEKVTKLLNPFGPCNFQLRIDRDGQPKIFEINARFSGTTYMRAQFGWNEVETVLNHVFKQPQPEVVLRCGTVRRFYQEMYIAEREDQ